MLYSVLFSVWLYIIIFYNFHTFNSDYSLKLCFFSLKIFKITYLLTGSKLTVAWMLECHVKMYVLLTSQ